MKGSHLPSPIATRPLPFRRSVWAVAITIGFSSWGGREIRAQDTPPRPHAKVGPVHQSEVVWTGGFWKQRSEICRKTMIPAMWEIMKGTD